MRHARDTFLRFLADNLPAISIHNIRREASNPETEKLQVNAINVSFLNMEFRPVESDLLVSIDVIHEDELTAADWTEQVWNVLNKRFFTEKLNYTVPAAPVATKYNIRWEPIAGFRPVYSPYYTHYTCRLKLIHFIP